MKQRLTREEKYFLNHKIIDNITYKKCSKCNKWFPENTDNFYLMNKSIPERGYQAECKECAIKRSQKYVKNHLDNYYKYNKERYWTHCEAYKERRRVWQQEKGELREKYQKQYWKSNPDKVREYNENRQHKNHIITLSEWTACKEYFNNSCAYCGLSAGQHYRGKKLIDLHKEHVDHEGSRYLDNCVPACASCNSTKWIHQMEEWYRKQDFFSEERLQKIYNWINKDYKQYIKTKPEKRKTT